jgi:hypothetical protein
MHRDPEGIVVRSPVLVHRSAHRVVWQAQPDQVVVDSQQVLAPGRNRVAIIEARAVARTAT